jgi:hypothetical protein
MYAPSDWLGYMGHEICKPSSRRRLSADFLLEHNQVAARFHQQNFCAFLRGHING